MRNSVDHAQISTALQTVPLFQELDEPNRHALAQQTRHRTYPADTALFHDGDSGHILYVILSGQVRLEKVSPNGETVYLATRGPGSHFGELSLLDGGPRMATAFTLTACECLTIEEDAFRRCLLNTPPVALKIMVSLAGRLREAADDLGAVQGLDVTGRLCRALLDMHAAAAGAPLHITHQELADRIGTTRESVTRALGSLRKTGLIRASGHSLLLLNTDALRRRSAV